MATFDAARYWQRRLAEQWSIAGTGHLQYSASYNTWLYRAKGHALRRALRALPTPGSALDVGSGTGWVLRELLEGGWQPRGCDIAPVAVERLNTELPTVAVLVADAARDRLPAASATLDLVTAIDVVYHLVDDDGARHLVSEVARVLRPGGHLVFSDTFGPADRTPAEHVRFRGEQSWRQLLGGHGLDVTRTQPYFRTLSRPPEASRLGRLPQAWRGAIEYTVDRWLPVPPWMRLVTARRGAVRSCGPARASGPTGPTAGD